MHVLLISYKVHYIIFVRKSNIISILSNIYGPTLIHDFMKTIIFHSCTNGAICCLFINISNEICALQFYFHPVTLQIFSPKRMARLPRFCSLQQSELQTLTQITSVLTS